MKRRTFFKLLLFLLAGAVINVAVAWGCAALSYTRPLVQRNLGKEGDLLLKNYANVNWTGATGVAKVHFGVRRFEALNFRDYGFGAGMDVIGVMEVAAGWPSVSFNGALVDVSGNRSTKNSFECTHPFLKSLRFGSDIAASGIGLIPFPQIVPTRVIWPGFAINTILYAAILWILFATPGALSRKRRLRRGQCVACGYSLRGRGNTTRECPECGATPFKQKAERAKVES